VPPQVDNKITEAVLKRALNLFCKYAVNNLKWLECLTILRNAVAIDAIVLNVVQSTARRLKV
jgi:hypothetical protein